MEKPILYKRLSELKTSEQGVITKVFGHGSFRNRITEMGFVRGKAVKVIKNAPLLDPIEYEIMGYRIALRKSEAELIEVTVAENAFGPSSRHGDATFRDESVNRFLHEAGKTINVALVGNPNCGKTSLFNTASGSHERVGNYSGVTVDAKEAHFRQDGYTIRLFDLPGTYSITEYTPEELYVRAHLLNEMPDVVVNVVDASNLERNLLLTTQLIDMNLKVVIALNMYDELERSGDTLNYRDLGRMIGIPIIPTVANRKEGIDALFKTVIDVFEDNEPVVRHIHINYGADIEQSIRTLQAKIWENKDLVARYSSRYLAIRLLGDDKNIREIVASRAANSDEIDATAARLREKLEHRYGEPAETIITDAKYGFIAGALEETYRSRNAGKKHVPADRIDRVMTMLIIPFMSCSARLPVYVLLISAFFPHNQGLVLFSIYLIGILIAVLSSVLFKKLLFAKQEAPFVMELPPYRIPTVHNVVRHMWDKGAQYLKKMGTVILLASIIIWALGHYPRNVEYSTDYAAEKALVAASDQSAEEKQAQIQHLDNCQYAEHQEKSYIGRIGHFIEPAIRPLGFDWRIGVSLASGLAAKEVIVSTMAVLNNSGDDETMLARNLQKQTYASGPKAGEHVYTPLVAYTLMIFILLYFPCIAAMAAIRREAGGRWALFTLFYTTALAWLLSLLVYQIGSLF